VKIFIGVFPTVLIQFFLVLVYLSAQSGQGPSAAGKSIFILVISLIFIPVTAILNILYIRTHKELEAKKLVISCVLIGVLTPVIIGIVSFIGFIMLLIFKS